ncbi:MAG: UvrD-helicase domain-containing protein [Planctomycetes bacterium]|nr:UvrD-helicase domain-containing protein [Planctomycetota bacterium]
MELDTRRKILEGVSDRQREAITHVDGPLLVLAGAGSGKTRVNPRRLGHLVSEGVPATRILAITFTNKAAGEMRSRVDEFLDVRGLWVSTFHSACARLLRRHAEALGYREHFTIYDTDDQIAVVKEALASLKIDATHYRPPVVLGRISAAKNDLIDPADYAVGDYFDQKVFDVYPVYQETLRRRNAMDFDDLLVNVVRLLRENADARETYQDQFQYLLVDEYQDTNRAQYEIVRLLGAKRKNVCVTGDPDQSIYGWRGADIGNILSFERDYPGCRVVVLDRNYRSTQVILDAANALIAHNADRKEKAMWSEERAGKAIEHRRYDDEGEEAGAIAAAAREAAREEGARYGDVAVLYRVTAQSRAIEERFVREGIPYVVVGGTAFYQRREIKDALAYLTILLNPVDDLSVRRVINVPARKLGKTAVARLSEHAAARGLSLLAAARDADAAPGLSPSARKAAAAFFDLFAPLAALGDFPVSPIVRAVVENTGLLASYRNSPDPQDVERAENLEELVVAAAEYDRRAENGSLAAFLEQAALVTSADRSELAPERVTLMTLHAAKGLEFHTVIIAGVEDGLFPLDRADDLEEERRLMYVGLTRARRRVILTSADWRARAGFSETRRPSRFIREMGKNAVAEIDHTAAGLARRLRARTGRGRRRDGADGDGDGGPSADEMRSEPPAYSPGQRVFHETFGQGVVTAVAGSRHSPKVVVTFDEHGEKTLAAAFARLVKLRV